MGLDIRTPIGSMFATLGVLMFGYGLATNGADMYARSGGHNINLWWGAVLVVFGATMLWLGRRNKAKAPKALTPER